MLRLTRPIAEFESCGRARVSDHAFEDGRYVLMWAGVDDDIDSLAAIDLYHDKMM